MLILQDLTLKLSCVSDLVKPLQDWLIAMDTVDQDKEHAVVVSLTVRNKVKCIDVVSVGTLDSCFINPRETFRRAVTVGAAKVIVAHNHPSNDCTPSDDDMACTRRLAMAGEIVGINVVDHLIFCSSSYYSLAEGGDL